MDLKKCNMTGFILLRIGANVVNTVMNYLVPNNVGKFLN
jgi:hypothetical protein